MEYSGETRIAWTAARTMSRAWVVGRLVTGGLVVEPTTLEVIEKLVVLATKLIIVCWDA
jgi:hypothetical protein